MKYLLDTDHLSLLQRKNSPERAMIVANINLHGELNSFACVASLHEQMLGAHNKIQQAKNTEDLFKGYGLIDTLMASYSAFEVLSFDHRAITEFLKLKSLNLRVGTLDLRIASIAMSKDMTVVTRNLSDFGRVPGLKVEDWTK